MNTAHVMEFGKKRIIVAASLVMFILTVTLLAVYLPGAIKTPDQDGLKTSNQDDLKTDGLKTSDQDGLKNTAPLEDKLTKKEKIISALKVLDNRTYEETENTEIPKIIWSIWHKREDTEAFKLVEQCFNGFKHFNPGYQVNLVLMDELSNYISTPLPSTFDMIDNTLKSDWTRLMLLKEHGGIYIDSSTVLTRNLSWIYDFQNSSKGLMFHFDAALRRPDGEFNVVENGFIASVKNAALIRAVADRITLFVENVGTTNNDLLWGLKTEYVDILKEHYGEKFETYRQNNKMLEYLQTHLTFQIVLNVNRIKPFSAYDTTARPFGGFVFATSYGWDTTKMVTAFAFEPAPEDIENQMAFIKFTGGMRHAIFDKLKQPGITYHPESIYSKYILTF